MQVSVEESGKIERKLTVSVPSQKIDSEVINRLRDVAKKARIPGFRPGKAPQRVIKKRYEPQVTQEVLTDTINSSYQDVLDQVNILPAGLLSIDTVPYEAGKDLEFVLTVELFPEIQHLSLEGKTIEQPVVEVTDEDLANRLDEIRNLRPNYVETEDKSETGDRVTIDFDGRISNETFPGGTGVDYPFILGNEDLLQDFDHGLLGAVKGEKKSIVFTFPENYGAKEVAGKEVEFDVTVKKVEKRETVELDDDFALNLGFSEGGIKRLREEIRADMGRALDEKMRRVMFLTIMDALLASNEIDIPTVLVEKEVDRTIKRVTEMLEQRVLPADPVDANTFYEDARRTVAYGLISREIVGKYEIKADYEQIEARARTLFANHEDPDMAVRRHLLDPEKLAQIESLVIEEQVISRMLETADVSHRKMAFGEFMKPQEEEQTA